jgi:hypothetical protein
METAPDKKDGEAGRIELQLAAWGAELDRLKAKVDQKIAEVQKAWDDLKPALQSAIAKFR